MLLLSKRSRLIPAVLALALGLGFAAPALAGSYYTWTTEDGVRAYTNDVKRIPKLYKNEARKRSFRSLAGYKQYTPSAHVGGNLHERLADRLGELQGRAGRESAGSATAAAGGATTHVRIDLEQLEVDVPQGLAGKPVVVEELRVRVPGSLATRTVKVIRQGDKVLAIVKPVANDTDASFPTRESDL